MYKSLEEIAQVSKQKNIPFWQVILEDDCKERWWVPSSQKRIDGNVSGDEEADAAYDANKSQEAVW